MNHLYPAWAIAITGMKVGMNPKSNHSQMCQIVGGPLDHHWWGLAGFELGSPRLNLMIWMPRPVLDPDVHHDGCWHLVITKVGLEGIFAGLFHQLMSILTVAMNVLAIWQMGLGMCKHANLKANHSLLCLQLLQNARLPKHDLLAVGKRLDIF